MSCITKQHVGKYTYLYESTSFRNAEGKPRNKKVRIGKIDPKTGNTIYTQEYLERMEAAGTPVAVEDNSDADADIVHAHVYFNPIKAATERNELYAYVTELKQEALKDPLQGSLQKDFKKYLIIRKCQLHSLVAHQRLASAHEGWQSV